ncbi:drug/metabolite transporter (DMT)-like permease [Actinopolyspora biskrensis]|uniref:Drug/metabolite transporter (DMT)-like permease n=1 Tax=Actinopolyspora biskrensis TaxID=1470178 RepID=A0A852Z5F8_9ACTN|nr:EamA family transporter [Actinopolyspora biskrensis]NYH78816.1 drug/metabolite transporter (DMT)-like permease [Actinopolyspora biskrensis]
MTDPGRDRTWLVAIATAMWGTDALWRMPLATSLPTTTVVLCEHLIVTLLLVPLLPRAWRAFRSCGPRERLGVLVVGAGTSALATLLFTAAFTYGDPVTPVVLQKLQPVFAGVASFLLLRERMGGWYPVFAVPAVLGAWMLAFPDPLQVSVSRVMPALLALGAAVLWAAGTVFGRMLSRELSAMEVTTLRYSVGLPTAALVVFFRDGSPWQGLSNIGEALAVGWGNIGGLLLLALIPGLLALSLYYLGMRTTAAARATVAELSFPATAAVVGVGVLGETLTVTQWIGFVLIVAMITALGWNERSGTGKAVGVEPVVAR